MDNDDNENKPNNKLVKYTYNSSPVHFDGEEMNLTEMWRAAGGQPHQKPNDWLRQFDTQGFLAAVRRDIIQEVGDTVQDRIAEVTLVRTERGGQGGGGGTWGHWQVAMGYAKYLNHEFHVWCNKVIREHVKTTSRPALAASSFFRSPFATKMELDISMSKYNLAISLTKEMQDEGVITTKQRVMILVGQARALFGLDLMPVSAPPPPAPVAHPVLSQNVPDMSVSHPAIALVTDDASLHGDTDAEVARLDFLPIFNEYMRVCHPKSKNNKRARSKILGDIARATKMYPLDAKGYRVTPEILSQCASFSCVKTIPKHEVRNGIMVEKWQREVQYKAAFLSVAKKFCLQALQIAMQTAPLPN